MSLQPIPLSEPTPIEVPLTRAPLARVIAQLRFAPILSIRNPDKVALFQEIIRATYPILNEERLQQFAVASVGSSETKESLIWRFSDRTHQPQWRVSLGVDFVAIETSAYTSRDDFLERLSVVIRGLEEHFKPAEVQRFGVRYIDRMTGEALEQINRLLQPGVLGIKNSNGPGTLANAVALLLTEAQLVAEEGNIQARWGVLPPSVTYDPDALEIVSEPSWVLDLDMFTTSARPFVTDAVMVTARQFAERIYFVFRQMVTEEFLRYYGGHV